MSRRLSKSNRNRRPLTRILRAGRTAFALGFLGANLLGSFAPRAGAAQPECYADAAHALIHASPKRHPPVRFEPTVSGAPQGSMYVPSTRLRERLLGLLDEFAQLARPQETPGALRLPDGLKIRLYLEDSGAAAHAEGGLIDLAVRFQATPALKHPRVNDIVFAHEWGHELLELNLRERAPELWELRSGDAFQSALPAYAEFFADLIPVLWKRDGRSARLPLHDPGVPLAKSPEVIARDFTWRHRAHRQLSSGPYSRLAPTRNWLWERTLRRPSTHKRSGELLEAVVDAIATSLEREVRLGIPELDPRSMTEAQMERAARRIVRQANRELETAIERELLRRGF